MTSREDTWTLAVEILTDRQLEALRLHDRGLSCRTIGLHMGVSSQRAARLVERAGQKIALEQAKRSEA